MINAKAIADKYIAPDGSPPKPGTVYVKTILKELAEQQKIDLLTVVCTFIVWHQKRDYHGGYNADEAWQALCAVLDVHDAERFRLIFLDQAST
jgi:hypothetical protein